MKSTSIFFLLVASLTSFAQSVPIYESVYTYPRLVSENQWSSDWNSRTIDFVYDWNRLVSKTHQSIENFPFAFDELESFEYDLDGNVIEHKLKAWNNGTWEYDKHFLYTFDLNGNEIERVEKRWDSGWSNFERWIYLYNNQGSRATFVKQSWQGGSWQNTTQDSSIYDSDNQLVEIQYNIWENGSWLQNSRSLYDFDSAGNVFRSTFQNLNDTVWNDYSRNTYSYDSNNNLTYSRHESFLGFWRTNNQTFWEYDLANRPIEKRDYLGQGLGGELLHYKYSYHQSGILQYQTFQMRQGSTIIDDGDSTWYNFSVSTSVVEHSEDDFVNLFPNPANQHFTLHLHEPDIYGIRVHNMEGQVVQIFQNLIGSRFELEIDNLSSGHYMVVVTDSHGHETFRKLVKL